MPDFRPDSAFSSSPSVPPLLIGCGAGFSGDRLDAAVPVVRTLVSRGGPACLIYETLAERTLALAQLRRRRDPEAGHDPRLESFLRPVLADCLAHGIAIVSNFGAANPRGAARRIGALAASLGLATPRIAVVEGDDLSGEPYRALLRDALGAPAADAEPVSANAYVGAEAIAGALRAGAQIVVCGRVADPSLALGPAIAHFGWALDDWDRLARGTIAGHLLECGAQVTGGYFADPGRKDVPDLAEVGFPIAEIDADGHCVIGKADATGGRVDARTVTEQLLYEIHDPAAYVTPDVVADISQACVLELGGDRVAVRGVRGHPRPERLKVNVCHEGGWLAEGEISYAGPGAEARARLAAEVLARRLPDRPLRFDLIGRVSLFADDAGSLLSSAQDGGGEDIRLRAATADASRESAERLAEEVAALYTCGPAGGGGIRTSVTARLSTTSCLVPRDAVRVAWSWAEPAAAGVAA
jgi:hypothetical protein